MVKKEITKEQIEAWKVKYGSVFKITVDNRVAYLRSPDRKTMSFASSVGAENPMKFNEILLKNCWLAGDEEIQTNDNLFMSISAQLAEIIEIKEAKLEKL